MKKIFLLIALISLANCSSLTGLREPKIKDQIYSSADLYFNPAMKNAYVFDSKKNVVSFNIQDVQKDFGTKQDNGSWSQNIGALSVKQFQDALTKAFTKVNLVNSNPGKAVNSDYLVVPTITDAKVTVRTISQSYVTIDYQIDVYDKLGKNVYSQKLQIERKGKFKSASMTSVGGIPISAKADINPDDSSMIFEAVCDGVDKIVNQLIASKKL